MTEPIDLTMVAYRRTGFTEQALWHLAERTRSPFRLTLVVNGWDELGEDEQDMYLMAQNHGIIDHLVILSENYGIHAAKNICLPFIRSRYYVDFDNDILVPDLDPDWLTRMVDLMDGRPEYAAIAMRPQVFVGTDESKIDWSSGIADFPWVGACGRIMRTDLVKAAGGWRPVWDSKRNNEERWICSKIKDLADCKFGYSRDIRCYHLFGDDNWGYGDQPIEEHGHNPIWPPTSHYEREVDSKTFEPL
ncbi:glycosyltransferase [bacterium]|nr:glycosyltransferase [bacterium]